MKSLTYISKVAVILSIVGCSSKVSINAKSVETGDISGKVFTGGALENSLRLSDSENCQSGAAGDVTLLEMDSTNSSSPKTKVILKTKLNKDGGYLIKNELLPEVQVTHRTKNYVLIAEMCDGTTLQKILTKRGEQNVDAVSSILSQAFLAKGNASDVKASFDGWLGLVSERNSTFANSIASMKNNNSLKDAISQYEISLSDLPPITQALTLKDLYKENTAYPMSLHSYHWDPDYRAAYVWKIDDQVISRERSFIWNTGANLQGKHYLSTYVGRGTSSDSKILDTKKPYLFRVYEINFDNNHLPTPPSFVVQGQTVNGVSNLVSSAQFKIVINTGADFINCDSFSSLGLAQDAETVDSVKFNIKCSTSGTQEASVTLNKDVEGEHTLSLFAIDSAGVKSAQPSKIKMYLIKSLSDANHRGWEKTGYSSVATIKATWKKSSSIALKTQKIQFFSGETCDVEQSVLTDINSATAESYSFTGVDGGIYSYKLTSEDVFGNTTTSACSAPMTFYLVSPAVATGLSWQEGAVSNAASLHLNWTKSVSPRLALQTIQLYADGTCATASGSPIEIQSNTIQTYTLSNPSDATYSFKVNSLDLAGNSGASACSAGIVYDSHAPVISVNTLSSSELAGGTSFTVNFNVTESNATSANSYIVEMWNGAAWVAFTTVAAPNGAVSAQAYTATANIPTANTTQAQFRVRYTDAMTNEGSATSTLFLVDSQAPVISSIQAAGGSTNLSNNNVPVNLAATDAMSNIVAVCFKTNITSTPTTSDTCWKPITAAPLNLTASQTLNISNYYFQLGFTNGTYNLYPWVKDQVGNISTLGNSGNGTVNTDKYTMTYTAPTPPAITTVIAANTNSPSSPPTIAERSAAASSTVYIKWNASSSSFGASPISLYYTTDDSTFTLIANNLTNTSNGGCATTGGFTGCYTWSSGSPVSSYYRVKVVATDTIGTASSSLTTAMNVSQIDFLAGNTDPGTGASASAATFFTDTTLGSNSPDHGILAISTRGVFFIRDYVRGIMVVDPADGILKVFIPANSAANSNAGDGGAVTGATVKRAMFMMIDYQDRLLIFDYDRIRVVTINHSNLNASTITTLIGGGASTAATITNPLDVQFTLPSASTVHFMTFAALPNGKIYFQSDGYLSSVPTGYRIRVYDPNATDKVTSIVVGGTGFNTNLTYDFTTGTVCTLRALGIRFDPADSSIKAVLAGISGTAASGCSATNGAMVKFDPTTWNAFTTGTFPSETGANAYGISFKQGMDGELYYIDRMTGKIKKYNQTTGLLDIVVGTTAMGVCADATNATSCYIRPEDVFVTQQGRMFLFEGGRVRYIGDDGKIYTLMGQARSYGDGGSALAARMGTVNRIDQRTTGQIVLLDRSEARFREFTIGGTIATIAGNGVEAAASTGVAAISTGITVTSAGPYWDDFVIDPANGNVFYHRSTYISKLDRGTGQWVDLVGGGANPYYTTGDGQTGANVGSLYYPVKIIGFSGTNVLGSPVRYNGANVTDNYLKLYNITNGTQTHLAGNANVAGASFSPDGDAVSSSSFPTSYGYFMLTQYNSNISSWLIAATSTSTIRTMPQGGVMGTFTTTGQPMNSYAYRRSGATDIIYYCGTNGRIYKKIVGGAENILTWPIASMYCTGRSLIYNSTRDSLIFPYTQSGLTGIAEYLAP